MSFGDNGHRARHTGYFLPTVEIKDYNVMKKNFFDQRVKNDQITYGNIQKITTGQGDDYTTGCLLDYPYFKECYKLIAIDLSKCYYNVTTDGKKPFLISKSKMIKNIW